MCLSLDCLAGSEGDARRAGALHDVTRAAAVGMNSSGRRFPFPLEWSAGSWDTWASWVSKKQRFQSRKRLHQPSGKQLKTLLARRIPQGASRQQRRAWHQPSSPAAHRRKWPTVAATFSANEPGKLSPPGHRSPCRATAEAIGIGDGWIPIRQNQVLPPLRGQVCPPHETRALR